MVRLNAKQVEQKIKFIENYISSKNAASGSIHDSNANVSTKNVSTLEAEINKDINIQINRELVRRRISSLYDADLGEEYIRQIEAHEIYVHDETSLKPYTYGASESIIVYKDGNKLLTTFEMLYNSYNDIPESILDDKDGVYAKYPENLYTEDISGISQITRLIRKERKRDLLLLKTKYGESIIVTDNHPMIIDIDNIDNTVEAKDSLGSKQYKKKIEFVDKKLSIKTDEIFSDYDNYGSYCISNINNYKKIEGIRSTINLNDKLGYAIGFFIAEGSYSDNFLTFTQSDKKTLENIANIIFDEIGISGKIYKDISPSHLARKQKYVLQYNSEFLYSLFFEYFGIMKYADRKNLPLNILETNKEFIDGLLSGIIDGDGTVSDNINIRLASRGLISQLSFLLNSFNFGFYHTYQEQDDDISFGVIRQNYPTFGICFGLTGDLDFSLSKKVQSKKEFITENTRYKNDITEIINIKKINNEKYLDNFIYDITTTSETFICNNLVVHNCTSISMYPFLLDGLTKLGGESHAPKHLDSFCGSFVNLIFAISSQFAGAVATVEWILYFDYFARKDFGENYLETHLEKVKNCFQHCVYAINQPAAARGYQAVFWNISIYDEYYFNSLFGEFVFPDMTTPNYVSVSKLQKTFMSWFNNERKINVLTFPVVTAAMLVDDEKPLDEDFNELCAKELSEGNSFFIYQSKHVDSLSSCCRLRSEMSDNTFSYTLGAGGVSTGSINVITINMNRLIQKGINLEEQLEKIYKYQIAYRSIMKDYLDNNMLPVYSAGFISIEKQFLTIGINGMVEAAEYLGYDISDNQEYKDFVSSILKVIYDSNKVAKKKYGVMFNTEFVPAENLGVKNSQWDKKDGLIVNRDCYNSYFYRVEDDINIIDKFILHGRENVKYLDGGSALHLNLESYPTKEGFKKLLSVAAKSGCNYFCFNIKITICEECNTIDKLTKYECPKCSSKNVSHATRVIGYLKKISSFSDKRQIEEGTRVYH